MGGESVPRLGLHAGLSDVPTDSTRSPICDRVARGTIANILKRHGLEPARGVRIGGHHAGNLDTPCGQVNDEEDVRQARASVHTSTVKRSVAASIPQCSCSNSCRVVRLFRSTEPQLRLTGS